MGGSLCAAAARTRLDRGSDHCDRISLGGGTQRAVRRDRGGVHASQGRCHRHSGNCGPRGKAGDIGHPDRVCPGGRPGWQRARCVTGSTGRQRHRAIAPTDRCRWQTLLGLEVTRSEIRRAEDIAAAVEALKGLADALYVVGDSLVDANRIRINTLALSARLPTMHIAKEFVEAGGLMSYGPNVADLFRRAGDYVDKILRGAKPGDLPVEQPTKFDLVINLTTAKALGLTLPETLLARADEVIE